MTTIKKLLEKHNANITIPEIWQNYEVDDEDEYTFHTEKQNGETIYVLRTEGYARDGTKGYDEIIIDLNKKLITFLGADGVMTQEDEKGNVTDSTV